MPHVLLRLRVEDGRKPMNLDEFLHRVGRPPKQAEELARGLWLLPLPDCQSWVDAVRARLGQTAGLSAMMREVDCVSPWQPVS
jgi:hypothetical protein